jgi:hypothetical protein
VGGARWSAPSGGVGSAVTRASVRRRLAAWARVGGELLAAGSGWPSGPGRGGGGERAMASCVGPGEGAVRCWAAERATGGAGPA